MASHMPDMNVIAIVLCCAFAGIVGGCQKAECDYDTYCTPYRCSTEGTCTSPCASNDECVSGFVCRYGDCVEGKEGTKCAVDADCASDLVCNVGYRPTQCKPLSWEGQPCERDAECQTGLSCNAGFNPLACRAPQAIGGPCALATDCQEGLRCVPWGSTSVCWRGTDGDPCFDACLDDDYACRPGTMCQAPFVCNGVYAPAVCKERGHWGQPCLVDQNCTDGLVCNAATVPPECRDSGMHGDACAEDRDCYSAYVCNAAWDPPTCRELGGADDICARDRDCQPECRCAYVDTEQKCVCE